MEGAELKSGKYNVWKDTRIPGSFLSLFLSLSSVCSHSYLRQAFSSLAHLYDSLSKALGGSWEGDVVLTPGLRALEKVVL